ncbi:MAG: GNAT family N-acetyltransferase [Chloroflexales bacterium]|nr:GNAT family N-acetyltransferase [Chloroflexales bacterium]
MLIAHSFALVTVRRLHPGPHRIVVQVTSVLLCEIEQGRGSADAFLARGFGFALFDGTEPVSWCLSACAVEPRCEIGIHTHPDYRRGGLATIVVATTVAHALAAGMARLAGIGAKTIKAPKGWWRRLVSRSPSARRTRSSPH